MQICIPQTGVTGVNEPRDDFVLRSSAASDFDSDDIIVQAFGELWW